MTISVLIDPSAPYRLPPVMPATAIRPARPVPANPLDREILATLKSASEPMGVWQMLNAIAKSAGPASRAEERSIRQQVLTRINPLLRSGFLRRIGRRFLGLP